MIGHEDHPKSLYQMGTGYFKLLYEMAFFVTSLIVTISIQTLYEHSVILPTRDGAVSVAKNNVWSRT